jgi:hypothetical protein
LIEEGIYTTSSLFPVTDSSEFSGYQNWKSSNVVVPEHYPSPLTPSAKKHIIKLWSFIDLSKNWDGYGADPVSPSAIAEAEKFIRIADNYLWQIYFVAPGKNGEVLVELSGKNGLNAEIYFNPDSSKELLVFQNDDCLYEGKFNLETLEQYFNRA